MPILDLETLLSPLSDAEPCGPNLEYDGINALELEAQGTPEQQVGNTFVPAQEADWRSVTKKALDLAGRTRDLRVGTLLARALLHTHGVAGFSEGVALVAGLVERYWATVHPQMEGDEDVVQRVNILLGLCDQAVLLPLRAAPIVSARAIGRFGLRDILMATGEEPAPEGTTAIERATIDAAFRQADLAELEAVRDAAGRADALLTLIADTVGERSGRPGEAPDFGRVSALLRKIHKVVSAKVDAVRAEAAPEAGVPTGDAGVVAGHSDDGGAFATNGNGHTAQGGLSAAVPGVAPRRTSVAIGGGGHISSPDDVRRLIDAICAYYDAAEPSSPVPMVLRRARRLVGRSFLDIMEDMAPGALELLAPFRPKEETESS